MCKPCRSLLASWPCFCQKVEGKFDDWGHQWHCRLKILEGCRNIFFSIPSAESLEYISSPQRLFAAPHPCVDCPMSTRMRILRTLQATWSLPSGFQDVAQTSNIWIWRTENFSKQSQVLTSPGNPPHRFRLGSSNGSQHTWAVTDTGKNTDYPCKHQGKTQSTPFSSLSLQEISQIHTIWWFTVQRAQKFLDRNKSCSDWHSQCTRIR